jgi:crotonobetainyl-CoA:carnitine CoA-transferase CaiB-like acyl-CoA transferase
VRRVQEIVGRHSAEELLTRLLARGIPCSPINTIADLSNHPQIEALGMFQRYDHPTLGTMKAVSMPITFDNQKDRVVGPPPVIGEHTREILAAAGYGDGDIDGFLKSGVASVAATRR